MSALLSHSSCSFKAFLRRLSDGMQCSHAVKAASWRAGWQPGVLSGYYLYFALFSSNAAAHYGKCRFMLQDHLWLSQHFVWAPRTAPVHKHLRLQSLSISTWQFSKVVFNYASADFTLEERVHESPRVKTWKDASVPPLSTFLKSLAQAECIFHG